MKKVLKDLKDSEIEEELELSDVQIGEVQTLAPESISEITVDFGRDDLNLLKDAVNKLIRRTS